MPGRLIDFLSEKIHGPQDDDVLNLCAEEVKRGCSEQAAKIIKKAYRSRKITESDAREYIRNLEYCNDIKEIIKRFAVYDPPAENKKTYDRNSAIVGAIYGDIAGSRYEGKRINLEENVPDEPPGLLFHMTDDSILTLATLQAIQEDRQPELRNQMSLTDITRTNAYPYRENPFTQIYKDAVRMYPDAGYGGHFLQWGFSEDPNPYGSCGNGAAMRVSPVGAIFDDRKQVIIHAFRSAMATHNHIEGVKGAVVTAMCIRMARAGYSKEQILGYVQKHYSYGTVLFREWTYGEACRIKDCQITCQYSVPAAVISFAESLDFKDAIRNAVCVGIDNDTNACICGGIAGAYYGVGDDVCNTVRDCCAQNRIGYPVC